MKAAIYKRFGPPEVLEIADVAKPVPKDNEILVRVRASTVTAGDWRARSRKTPAGFGLLAPLVFGIFAPRQPILGTELAGDVEAVGSKVTKFKVGDAVFAQTGIGYGGYAEYRALRETAPIALKPANLSYEEAAGLPFGGGTALHFFRLAKLKAGETILISGASGGVGVAAVQLAKHFGAHVTAVCSGANADLVRSLGADRVIDYTKEDFRQTGERWDLVMDMTGTVTVDNAAGTVKPGGRMLIVAGTLAELFSGGKAKKLGFSIVAGPASETVEAMRELADLAARGVYRTVIDRTYPLEQIVDAHRYVETGRKRGTVAITVAGH